MTIAIAFNGGAYGTYLEWVLTTLTNDLVIQPPFQDNGGSHKFSGNTLHYINAIEWELYTKNPKRPAFVKLHPKTLSSESLFDNLKKILHYADKLLYIYPDKGSVLLNINNNYEKIKGDWWEHKRRNDVTFINNLYSKWEIDPALPLASIPIWIKREFLSYNMMPSWFDEVEWHCPDEWQHTRSKTILIKDLLFNFEKTILDIQQFCHLDFKKSITEMIPYHNTMLSLQKNINQDQLCSDIVKTTVNNIPFDWSEEHLPLPSQAWIQWQLRNLGHEMQCADIDIFPTNSVQLKKLLSISNEFI